MALLRTSINKCLNMHLLIQFMGKEIILFEKNCLTICTSLSSDLIAFLISGILSTHRTLLQWLVFFLNSSLINACMHGHRASSQYRSSDSSTSFLTVLQNNIYSAYGGKFYYPAAASGSPGVYLNYYPFYAQHGQNSPSYYPRVIQNSQQYNAFGTLSNPTSASSLPNTSLVSWAILFMWCFMNTTLTYDNMLCMQKQQKQDLPR